MAQHRAGDRHMRVAGIGDYEVTFPQTWYSVSHRYIEPVTVVAETEKTITVKIGPYKPNRVNKQSEFGKYFRTWQEARDFMITRIESRVEQAKRNLAADEPALERLRKMTEAPEADKVTGVSVVI